MNCFQVSAKLRKKINNHGLTGVLYRGALTAINSCVLFRVLKFITIRTPNPTFLETNPRYRCGFLTAEQLFAFVRNGKNELSADFVESALAKDDECYGILDGDVLASYGWYTKTTTGINRDLELNFDSQFIYMYNGYTRDDYRGQRLHAIGMTHALRAYLERGTTGLVSFVDGDNFDSLKSCYRMGYTDIGTVYAMKCFDRYFLWHSTGCRDYHIRVDEIHSVKIAGFPTPIAKGE